MRNWPRLLAPTLALAALLPGTGCGVGSDGDNDFGYAVGLGQDLVATSMPDASVGGRSPGRVLLFGPGDDGWARAGLIELGPGSDWLGHAMCIERGRLLMARGPHRTTEPPFASHLLSGGTDLVGGVGLPFLGKAAPRRIAAFGARALVSATASDGQGAAVVCRFEGGEWFQESALRTEGIGPTDHFGQSVALGEDMALVGVSLYSLDGPHTHGAFASFVRDDGDWSQDQIVIAAEPEAGAQMGHALAIDHDRALAGAPFRMVGGAFRAGAAHLFRRRDGVWVQEDRLEASAPSVGALAGSAVALLGTVAVLGAPQEEVDGVKGAGAVHVLEWDGGWREVARLTEPVPRHGGHFGYSLALRDVRLVVGAPALGGGLGAAHLFRHEGGRWDHVAQFTAEEPR